MGNKEEYRGKPLLICRKCLKDKKNVPWGFMTYNAARFKMQRMRKST